MDWRESGLLVLTVRPLRKANSFTVIHNNEWTILFYSGDKILSTEYQRNIFYVSNFSLTSYEEEEIFCWLKKIVIYKNHNNERFKRLHSEKFQVSKLNCQCWSFDANSCDFDEAITVKRRKNKIRYRSFYDIKMY